MNRFLFVCVIFSLFVSSSHAQQTEPEPGIYRGYITVTRSNEALRLRDVVTLIIVGEIYPNGPGRAQLAWTARNFDQSSRLANQWADFALIYAELQNIIPDMGIWGSSQSALNGGTTVPGSFKMTANSLAWKCRKEGNAPYARNIVITTSLSITRSGPSPAPDLNQ